MIAGGQGGAADATDHQGRRLSRAGFGQGQARIAAGVEKHHRHAAVALNAAAVIGKAGQRPALHVLHRIDAAGVNQVVDHAVALLVHIHLDAMGEAEGPDAEAGADVAGSGGCPHRLVVPLRAIAAPDAEVIAFLEGVQGLLQAVIGLGAAEQQGAHGRVEIGVVFGDGADHLPARGGGVALGAGPAGGGKGGHQAILAADVDQADGVLRLAAGIAPGGNTFHQRAQFGGGCGRRRLPTGQADIFPSSSGKSTATSISVPVP